VSDGWDAAYFAVTVALGDTIDDAQRSLGAAQGEAAPASSRAGAFVEAMRNGTREARVRALAHALSEVALGVEAMVLS
jgi:hypothetical protein